MKTIFAILIFVTSSVKSQNITNIIQFKGIASYPLRREWLTTNILLYEDMSCKMQVMTYISKQKYKDNIIESFTETNGLYKKNNDTIYIQLNDEIQERIFLLRRGKIYPIFNDKILKTDGIWTFK